MRTKTSKDPSCTETSRGREPEREKDRESVRESEREREIARAGHIVSRVYNCTESKKFLTSPF